MYQVGKSSDQVFVKSVLNGSLSKIYKVSLQKDNVLKKREEKPKMVQASEVLYYFNFDTNNQKGINYKQISILKPFFNNNNLNKLFEKNVEFDEACYKEYNQIFNQKPKMEYLSNVDMNMLLTDSEFFTYKSDAKESLNILDQEKLYSKFDSLYKDNKKIDDLSHQKRETLILKDIKIFKILLAKTIMKGLQSKDYSYYTINLDTNLALKILDKCKAGKDSFEKIYKNVVMEFQNRNFEKWGIRTIERKDKNGELIGNLIIIPKTDLKSKNYQERYKVIQTHSANTWCTHTWMASSYMGKGDIIIYKPITKELYDNSQNIVFRYENDKINEIEDYKNSRNVNADNFPKYLEIMDDFQDITGYDKFSNELKIKFKIGEVMYCSKNNYSQQIVKAFKDLKERDIFDLMKVNNFVDINKKLMFNDNPDVKNELYSFNKLCLSDIKKITKNDRYAFSYDVFEYLNEYFKGDEYKKYKNSIKEYNKEYLRKIYVSKTSLPQFQYNMFLNYLGCEQDEDIQFMLEKIKKQIEQVESDDLFIF